MKDELMGAKARGEGGPTWEEEEERVNWEDEIIQEKRVECVLWAK